MADKKSNWRTVLQQIVTFNLDKNNSDPFWLMISRRLTKRKMESGEKERGGEEGEPGPSTSAPVGPALLSEPATNRRCRTGDNCSKAHRFTVLIGDHGDSLDKMSKLQFECPLADSWIDKYDDCEPISTLASGDDNMDKVMKKLQTAAGYEFLKLLTEGRFSKVYLSKPHGDEKKAVFKVTSKRRKILNKEDNSHNSGPAKRTRLRFNYAALSEEAQIHNNFKHKNIVQLFGYLVENERLGIVMEWCSFGSLDRLLKKLYSGLLTENVARRYYQQMVNAVEYVHNMGYIHRDICCRHFLIDHENVIKLCDFGLAERSQGTYTRSDLEVGSLGYQSPEYLQGLHYDGKQFDLWALGCCLYKMATARLPFGTDGRKLLKGPGGSVRLEFPNPSVRMSSELKELLNGLLMILPGSRFSMTRIKNSPWLRQEDSRVFISNTHLLRQPHRTSSSVEEEIWKSSLDI